MLILAACMLAACQPRSAAAPQTLTIFAAASLTGAFEELAGQFEAGHPGVDVVLNFAGSNQLAQQLALGAPADIFASANPQQMQVVLDAGRVASGAPQDFAGNRLVVIYPAGNPGGLQALPDLATPGMRLVLAAPAVPVGQYTLDFLDKASQASEFPAGYKDQVLANVVSYEENVRSVLGKVALGEADAGVVYTSDIQGSDAAEIGRLEIPDAFNTVATYPIAPLTDSAQPVLAESFISLVLSSEGQAVLETYGFLPIEP